MKHRLNLRNCFRIRVTPYLTNNSCFQKIKPCFNYSVRFVIISKRLSIEIKYEKKGKQSFKGRLLKLTPGFTSFPSKNAFRSSKYSRSVSCLLSSFFEVSGSDSEYRLSPMTSPSPALSETVASSSSFVYKQRYRFFTIFNLHLLIN